MFVLNPPYEFINERDEDGDPTGAVEIRAEGGLSVWLSFAPMWMVEVAK